MIASIYPVIAARRGARGLEVCGRRRRIVQAYFPLETVGIAEEEAQSDTEVGHESVCGPAFKEAGTDSVERLRRRRLKANVVEAPPAKHRRLMVGLSVPDDLEEIEHGRRTNLHKGEPQVSLHGVVEHGCVKHVPIKGVEPICVLGEYCHVIDAGRQHVISFTQCQLGARPSHCTGSALHAMLFLETLRQMLFIFNGLRSHYGQRALLGYHYPRAGLIERV
jgi:hypothetical protein